MWLTSWDTRGYRAVVAVYVCRALSNLISVMMSSLPATPLLVCNVKTLLVYKVCKTLAPMCLGPRDSGSLRPGGRHM